MTDLAAQAKPPRRLCNGYKARLAPSPADASKIRVLIDHAQYTQLGLDAHAFGLGRRSYTPTNHPSPVCDTALTWESS